MSVEESSDTPATGQTSHDGLKGAGRRLAEAREEQKRDIPSVATALHLRVEIVEALEAGNEAALPAITFVRGYIKSYARLLGLDEQAVLRMLPDAVEYRAAPLKAVGMPRRKPPVRLPVGRGLVWLAVIGAVVVAALYGVPVAERLWNKQTGVEDAPEALELPLGMQLAPELDTTSEVEAVEEPLVEEVAESSPETKQNPDTGEAVSAETAESEGEKPGTASAGPALVVMRFKEDSWVEMESNGRKLVSGTQPAGSERSVRAEPPISILLGNAPGVEIEYRGSPVDIAPSTRGKVARLVLED